VDKSLSKAIMQARTAKENAKERLATAINEKPRVVAEYDPEEPVSWLEHAQVKPWAEALGGCSAKWCPLICQPRGQKLRASTVNRGGPPKSRSDAFIYLARIGNININ
jgi:hypothetical protein